MTIGVSNKFYKGANFKGVTQIKSNSSIFSSGSGGKLTYALAMLFGQQAQRQFYLSYNTIAHGDSMPTALEAFQDALLTRSLISLFGARGSADFAQYIYANGRIISIWDIILAADNFIGKSRSSGGISKQPVTLSLGSERADAMKYAKTKDAWIRVYQVNEAINKMKLSAQLNVGKLIEMGRSIYS